jgi:UDP-GlcNAc:undecaprenyl-phosphate GlcNAc-1-phosphate transferase
MTFLSALLLALFITVTLIPLLKTTALRFNAVDVPDARKVHLQPMPRVGGIAMALGILLPVIFWAPASAFSRALISGGAVIVVFGLMDDVIDLGYRAKFIGQIMAALCVIVFGDLQVRSLGDLLPGVTLPPAVAVPLTCFLVVAAANAINLSDGLDGLAGGISLVMFICLGLISYEAHKLFGVFVSVAATGAIFGFLRYNTYPAVIFMGDTGSQLLGFLAMCLAIWISQTVGPISVALPIVLLGFPLLDTLIVMSERILRGDSPFKADKNHLHHKLMRLGLHHNEAVVAVYLHQIVLIGFAYLGRYQSDRFLLGAYLCFAAVVLVGSTVADRRGWKVPRFDIWDRTIKGWLRTMVREERMPIKVVFRITIVLAPTLLVMTGLLMDAVPRYFALLCLPMAAALLLAVMLQLRSQVTLLRLALYVGMPFIIYQSSASGIERLPDLLRHAFNITHGALVFFAILTLKLTRRRRGFRATPMDFLILFVAVVVPYFPNPHVQSLHMGIVATRILVLLFSYEVLIGELRGRVTAHALIVAAVLLLTAWRGLV